MLTRRIKKNNQTTRIKSIHTGLNKQKLLRDMNANDMFPGSLLSVVFHDKTVA